MNNIFNDDAYLREINTEVIDLITEDNKKYLVLKDNIFHPQGGGQKGDKGSITAENKSEAFAVVNTIKKMSGDKPLSLLEVSEDVESDIIGTQAKCMLDWPYRYSQMRLHSALHLFHLCLERALGRELIYPKVSTIKDDMEAFMQYVSDELTEEIYNQAKDIFIKLINQDGEIKRYPDKEKPGFWWWEYAEIKIPCGGTHVKNIREIGDADLAFSTKKGYKTISFRLKAV